jgi:hypothetical protein
MMAPLKIRAFSQGDDMTDGSADVRPPLRI